MVLGILMLATTSMAGECVLKIKREACAGKEDIAFKPYGGKTETEEKNKAADAAACKSSAEKAAKIVRKGTLTKKTVTYALDGKDGGSASDSADCK